MNIPKKYVYLHCEPINVKMEILIEKEYLRQLYEDGKSKDKKHRFQPQVVKKYTKVVDLMIASPNTFSLAKYNSLRYEKLVGDKTGISSVRVNDQYRIEFIEQVEDGETFATICNLIELSNHYQ